jgi:hypothetical protein
VSKVPTEIGSLARAFTERGIQILGGIAENNPDDRVKMEALEMLFNRGWGTATQEVKHSGVGASGAHEIIIRHITEGVKAPKR